MGLTAWREPLFVAIADGPVLTAAAEALLVTDVTIKAGYMYPGRILKATMYGRASNAVTTPGTLTLRARWGGLAGTVLGASAALTQNIIVQTNISWWWEMYIVCRTQGTAGSFMTHGTAHRGNQAAAVAADETPDLIPPNTLAAVTVDTTIDKVLSFTAQPSLGTASITCHSYILEALN
jgi:hypothetical protein